MPRKILLPILIVAVLLLAVPLVLVLARPAPRYLSVSGEASVKVVPDRARLTLGVAADGATAKEAQAAAAKRLAAVLAALKSLGVEEKDIRTQIISLGPIREYNPKDGRERLRGYRAVNQLEVILVDLKTVGEVLDAAVAAGANTAGGIGFFLSDPAAQRTAALARAFKDAQARASSLAKAAGRRLVGAVSISEEAMTMPQPETFLRAAKLAGDATPVEPGQITVRAQVRVRFQAR
ncbi:MAG: SIMPL domain-containing protein [Firmicutes bacterium]|nr:SIMPL domain-containing protein [Bacillota bacterium]